MNEMEPPRKRRCAVTSGSVAKTRDEWRHVGDGFDLKGAARSSVVANASKGCTVRRKGDHVKKFGSVSLNSVLFS